MKKDRTALTELVKKQNLPELQYRISEYWDEEDQKHEGLTDIEYLIREAEWIVEDFCEDTGHSLHDDYQWAKKLLKETDNGKRRPIDITTMRIKEGYRDADIENARSIIDEVKRTKAFIRKMKRMA